MTMTQWNAHIGHLDQHITWPATGSEIIAACNGEDVEPSVLNEMKSKLVPDQTYTQEQVKNLLVA